MRLVIDRQSAAGDPLLVKSLGVLIRDDIAFLSASYPRFNHWFVTRVLPGVISGERTVCLELIDGKIAALMILKHAQREKKICTLRVRPEFENSGLGIRLFKEAFELLDTGLPLLSVSDKALPKFERVFQYFGFHNEGIYKGIYLPNSVEHSFNGLLTPVRETTLEIS
jgi:hypothetical protein